VPIDYLARKRASFLDILTSSLKEELQNNTQMFHFCFKI